MFIDTHAHLNHERFFQQEAQAIQRANEAGVGIIVNVGFSIPASWRALELADQYEGLYAVVGTHPHDAKDYTPAMLDEVRELAQFEKVVGIGEAGLDFHYDNSPRPQQKAVFVEFVHLAAELAKPLIVHSREAEQATLDILDEHLQPGQKVIMHCFGSDYNYARNCVDRGFLLGIAGPLSFPNAKALQIVGERISLDHMVLETDCPYLAPQPVRGRTNEPAFIPMIAEKLAQLQGLTVGDVEERTTATARAFYGIG